MKNGASEKVKRFTLEEIKKMRGQTNWARLHAEELAEKRLAQSVKETPPKRQ